MEVTKKLVFLFMVFALGCGQEEKGKAQFLPPKSECESQVVPNEYIVKWASGKHSIIQASSEEEFLNSFLTTQSHNVISTEPNYAILEEAPTGPPGTSAPNWGQDYTNASFAWDQEIKGDGIKIAVIDSGVDITHPQLANQLFKNPGEDGLDANGVSLATNGIDDDENGFIDDISGWDFTGSTNGNKGGALVSDPKGHGTHVSGIILAEHENGLIKGLAPKAKLIPLRFMDVIGLGTIGNAIKAIDYAVQMKAQIINASWGGAGCSKLLKDLILSLSEKNILFVAAAGNEGISLDYNTRFPASYNALTQITVAASTDNNLMAWFSNYGKQVHIFGPGVDILSTWPIEITNKGELPYTYQNGTSMAAPFVAGAAALLWSSKPEATALEIKDALMAVNEGQNFCCVENKGLLNIQDALNNLK